MLGNSCPNTFQPKSGEETFADVPFSPDIHRSRPLEALSCGQFDFFVCGIIQVVFFFKFAGLEAEGELEGSSLSACLYLLRAADVHCAFFFFFFAFEQR